MSEPRRAFPWLRLLLAVLLLGAGAQRFAAGLEARAGLEPEALVAGPGLLPGFEDAGHTEIRTSLLALPAPYVAAEGASSRSVGVGLMGAALGLAFLLSLRASGAPTRAKALLPRLAWLLPGCLGLHRIASGASADAATVEIARTAFESWLPLVGLSFVLLVAWRR